MIGWIAAAYITTAIILYFREQERLNWSGLISSFFVLLLLPAAKIADIIVERFKRK